MDKATANFLRQQAFNNSLQANLILLPGSGKILIVNKAACKLLGYSKKELESMTSALVFDTSEAGFKKMHNEKIEKGSSVAYVTAIKKNGKRFPCEIASVIFPGPNRKKLIITTITDMRKVILDQKNIDLVKEQLVADNIASAKNKQKNIDSIREKLVAKNIGIALSKQKNIDIINEKIVADNIAIANAKQKRIDDRQLKLNKKQLQDATEDARETERSDIGKELHDNVNQLLGASRMYLEMGKKGGENSEEYFQRSSEYTLTAIEEIRKLTRGLITDIIKNLGLCQGIENICNDVREITGMKVSCDLEKFSENNVSDKFKLNVFRMVQEQLNNIMKHAAATSVKITLAQDNGTVLLTVTDNGTGFDPAKISNGIGLENIKSRAAIYNGLVRFVSQPGQGCALHVSFPLSQPLSNL